jgi:hypothetical protein
MKVFKVVYEGRSNGVRGSWCTRAASAGAARDEFYRLSSPLWYEVLWVVEVSAWSGQRS